MCDGNDVREQFLRLYTAWRRGAAGSNEEGMALLQELMNGQREDYGRFLIPAGLERSAPGFRESARAAQDAPDPALLVGELIGAEKRLTYATNLSRYGIRVWGDAGWKHVVPHGVNYMGPAGHGSELTQIYNRSRINLDIGRVYQPDIVTMRVFDVLACGAFVLAAHSEELERAFRCDEEVSSYRTIQELRDKVGYYLEHPEEARDIAARGRERVLAEHTIAGRIQHMAAKRRLTHAVSCADGGVSAAPQQPPKPPRSSSSHSRARWLQTQLRFTSSTWRMRSRANAAGFASRRASVASNRPANASENSRIPREPGAGPATSSACPKPVSGSAPRCVVDDRQPSGERLHDDDAARLGEGVRVGEDGDAPRSACTSSGCANEPW